MVNEWCSSGTMADRDPTKVNFFVSIRKQKKKKHSAPRAGERAPWLGALAAFSGNLVLISTTHRAAHSSITPVPRNPVSSCSLCGYSTQVVHTHKFRENI